jgi:hypothetical protein
MNAMHNWFCLLFPYVNVTRRIGTCELSPSRRSLSRRTLWWLLRRSLRELWALELNIDRISVILVYNQSYTAPILGCSYASYALFHIPCALAIVRCCSGNGLGMSPCCEGTGASAASVML